MVKVILHTQRRRAFLEYWALHAQVFWHIQIRLECDLRNTNAMKVYQSWCLDSCHLKDILLQANQETLVVESTQPYFHMKSVLEGLQAIFKQTFDLHMEATPLGPGEVPAVSVTADVVLIAMDLQCEQRKDGIDHCIWPLVGEGWAPGVLKLKFSHEIEGPLGDLYIDPLAR